MYLMHSQKVLRNPTINIIYRRLCSTPNIRPYGHDLPPGKWGENRLLRQELACAYRALNRFDLNEGVDNHISVMAPVREGEGDDVMLVGPYGVHWSQMTASAMIGLNSSALPVEGTALVDTTASCIHLGIRMIRPDIKAILHTHQPYSTALASMQDPKLKMVHQNSARFYNRIAYDQTFSGLALAIDEGKRLGEALGDKDVLFMANHGVLTVGRSIAEAFDDLYYLEKAAMLQVLCTNMQKPINEISNDEAKKCFHQFIKDSKYYAESHFYGIYKTIKEEDSNFDN